jgi:hypothetical protein
VLDRQIMGLDISVQPLTDFTPHTLGMINHHVVNVVVCIVENLTAVMYSTMNRAVIAGRGVWVLHW